MKNVWKSNKCGHGVGSSWSKPGTDSDNFLCETFDLNFINIIGNIV